MYYVRPSVNRKTQNDHADVDTIFLLAARLLLSFESCGAKYHTTYLKRLDIATISFRRCIFDSFNEISLRLMMVCLVDGEEARPTSSDV